MTGTQQQIEGYWDVVPKVQAVSFPTTDLLIVELEDGRIISMPLDRFPSIQKLTPDQRQHWYVYGNGFSFDDSDEVIHIEQILGNVKTYRHES
ncbi:DUF2442 domain-containing protein [Spirosoma sp. KNUC1025]|uniref:DUF2442 domain-containing protein n=1 Tax=Spirosoma sp. KNUC1025 TaxID=2894082 RepID=UPI00386DC243|nr:DUF2442 domain-containing protein [Spirosoma sp. KNUC1025]